MTAKTMKPVKITADNAPKIRAVLEKANEGATAHTYDYIAILRLAEWAEMELMRFIPARAAPGASLVSISGGAVARCYKAMRIATRVKILRRRTGWYLVEAHRFHIGPQGGGKAKLCLTPAQRDEAFARLAQKFYVAP